MIVSDLINLLGECPKEMEVKLFISHERRIVKPLNDDHVMLTSKTAYIDDDAPEDEWDTEYGKICLGDGERYLIINPIIL